MVSFYERGRVCGLWPSVVRWWASGVICNILHVYITYYITCVYYGIYYILGGFCAALCCPERVRYSALVCVRCDVAKLRFDGVSVLA